MFLHLYWDIQKKVHIFKNRMFEIFSGPIYNYSFQ